MTTVQPIPSNLIEQTMLDGAKQLEGFTTMVETPKYDSFRVSVHDTFVEQDYLLSLDGVKFFSKGDIHALKAKQKAGKTTAIAVMTAVILCGKWSRLKCEQEHDEHVLIVDTEMRAADAQEMYKRVFRMAKLPEEDIYDRFEYYRLRSLSREEKMNAVRALIIEHKPDIVFIDGVVDLIGNFNEVEQSKAVIEELMQLCTKEIVGKESAIVLVLHTNKAKDDDNMRGHLGTMLAQKAGTVLEVKKCDGYMTVSNSDARHRQVPDWSFMYDNCTGEVVPADELRDTRLLEERLAREADKQYQQEQVRQQRVEKVKEIVRDAGGQIAKGTLKIQLAKELKLGRSSIDTLVHKWLEDETLVENVNKVIALGSSNPNLT